MDCFLHFNCLSLPPIKIVIFVLEFKEVVDWLSKNLNVNENALEKWDDCRAYRHKLLNDTKSPVSLTSYLTKFPILRQPEGHLLVRNHIYRFCIFNIM